jgi:hypothetical protein
MSEPRIHINMHLNGMVTLTDFAKIASLVRPEYYDGESTLQPRTASNINPIMSEIRSTDSVRSEEGPIPEADPALTKTSDEIDAHGWPWSAELHASTKGTTKDGLWRMKVGVTRPDPKPGFPVTTETPSATSTASPASPVVDTVTEPAGSTLIEEPASAAASQDEDDEFAAFRAAAAASDANDEAAKVNVPARNYSDADLGALCNQAAVKMGDPTPVKELIAAHVPEGEVAHSRNIPADQRAAFVAAVEEKAGIEFAG